MFESLSEKLQKAFERLGGKGILTEEAVDGALHEVQMALLEADVNYRVVKSFIATVRERATGVEILKGLEPAQQVVKIVDEELTALLGGSDDNTKLTYAPKGLTIFMLVGLQGSGKTTHAGKLATFVRKQGRNPLLVACDVYRPAAIKQLQVVGEQVKTPVFTVDGSVDPVEIAKRGVQEAELTGRDIVIIDTAGRLQIDDSLMDELKRMKAAVTPTEILLVLDSMTGQEAVNVAKGFNDTLDVDGFILTKFDSDTRGGAALSLKTVADKPIKFIGVGEKMDALEAFHPDRMASRILGMGDVLSLIEKVQSEIDEKQSAEMEKKLRANSFDFEDFLEQMRQLKKLGPLEKLLGLLPGVGNALKDVQIDDGQMKHVEAMILSMTPGERANPAIITPPRRRRIATGSGTTIQEVNNLITRFDGMRKIIGKGLNDPRAMQAAAQSGQSPFAMPGMGARVGKHAGSNRSANNKKKNKNRKLPYAW
ncbi:MAG TPA: signal recognition particle protein [Capsulimonadaceae bacterium]|jgi:signal recognition particle subunit SRP54